MIPRVTVLQLDTGFPRIAGDVGCADSYARPPQIIRIAGASVGRIVTDRPQDIDITPFEEALSHAEGDIITTSCGFLSYWQTHLAALTDRPFVSSALIALPTLAQRYRPDQLRILTFDATTLGPAHLGDHPQYAASLIGLPPDHHLRQVITQDLSPLNPTRASAEIVDLISDNHTAEHKHILLECTNLPPYRAAITAATGLLVTDILSVIEAGCKGSIAAEFACAP
ncbi:MAG: hypothetical protein ABJJ53_06790 [Sulfitobacter sp.]